MMKKLKDKPDKKIYPYCIAFFLGSLSSTLLTMGRLSKKSMRTEMIMYLQTGDLSIFTMFIILDIMMLIVTITLFLILEMKRGKAKCQ